MPSWPEAGAGFLLELLSAILYLAVGILLLVNPVGGAWR